MRDKLKLTMLAIVGVVALANRANSATLEQVKKLVGAYCIPSESACFEYGAIFEPIYNGPSYYSGEYHANCTCHDDKWLYYDPTEQKCKVKCSAGYQPVKRDRCGSGVGKVLLKRKF